MPSVHPKNQYPRFPPPPPLPPPPFTFSQIRSRPICYLLCTAIYLLEFSRRPRFSARRRAFCPVWHLGPSVPPAFFDPAPFLPLPAPSSALARPRRFSSSVRYSITKAILISTIVPTAQRRY